MVSSSVVSSLEAEQFEPAPVDDFALGGRALRGRLPLRTIALGALGSILMLIGSLGAGGILIHDPILGSGPLSALRYGHGQYLANGMVYLGFGLLVWAWVRLGRGVLANLVGSRDVLIAGMAWIAPLLIGPPLFTRDVYSYLGQGLLALHGLDPYSLGPSALSGPIVQNVHWFWQNTPAPYGPLFIGIAKVIVLLFGDNLVASVIVMRLVLLSGLIMLVFALPGLVRQLGGRLPVALWLAIASPITVVHLVGGPHNDMLMIGLLALGTLQMLEHRHVRGIVLVSLAMAVKATAGLALPFMVWIWASRLDGPPRQRFWRALAPAGALFTVVFGACMVTAKVGFGWISALSAPSLLINYLSPPTGLGELLHAVFSWIIPASPAAFIGVTRTLGLIVFGLILLRQWWEAREGGPDAVRRAAIVLFAAAILSPTTLPWYLSWGLALGCALPWRRRGLSLVVAGSVALVLAYYPNGEQALYNWPFVALALGASWLAAQSLLRFDPLGLSSLFQHRPNWLHGVDDAGSTSVLSPTPDLKADKASE